LGKREMNFCSVNVEVSSGYIRLRCYLRAGVTPRFAQHYPKISTGLPRIFHRGNPVETWGSPIQTPTGTKFPKIAPSTAGNYRTENAKGLPEAQRCSCYIRHRKSMLSRIEEMSTEILRAFSICATESAQLCEGAFGGSAPDANRLRKKCKTEPAAVTGGSEAAERRTPNATILPAIARNAAATHAAAPPRSTPPTGVGSVTLVALTFFRSLSKSKAAFDFERLRKNVSATRVTEPTPVGGVLRGGAAACVAAAFRAIAGSIVAFGVRLSAASDPPATAAGSVLHFFRRRFASGALPPKAPSQS